MTSSSFKFRCAKTGSSTEPNAGFLSSSTIFAQRDRAQALERLFPCYFQRPFEMSGYFLLILAELRGYGLSDLLHFFFRVQFRRGSVKKQVELCPLRAR